MEAELVHNVLRLNDVRARNILTPRNVVVRLSDQQAVGDVRDLIGNVKFARIPVYSGEDPEHWTGVVLLRDILVHMARNRLSTTIGALAKPLHFVPDSVRGHVLLKAFLLQRAHLFGVIDEFGSVVGVVTLEDVLESLLGTEIVDESDTTVDLQEPGRRRREELL